MTWISVMEMRMAYYYVSNHSILFTNEETEAEVRRLAWGYTAGKWQI
jgi:hypothetical protein